MAARSNYCYADAARLCGALAEHAALGLAGKTAFGT